MESYVVRNLTKTDIMLGEIRAKVPAEKTVDLLKTTPGLTMDKVNEQKKIGTLGIRLKQGRLVEINSTEAAQKMKVISKPTVFKEKVENIIFPDKIERGVIMKENASLLDSEIVKEAVVATPPPPRDLIEPKLIENQTEAKQTYEAVVMDESQMDIVEEDAPVAKSKIIKDEEALVIIADDGTKDDPEIVKKSAPYVERAKSSQPILKKTKGASKNAVVAAKDRLIAVITEDALEEARPVKIKANESDGLAAIPPTRKQAEEGKTVGGIMSNVDTKVEMDGAAVIMKKDGRCQALNRFGKQCINSSKDGEDYCGVHLKLQEEPE